MQQPVLTDQQLINSYLKGNEHHLEVLITRHKEKVFTSIYFLVKDRELAEDLFQDTFIKVINTLRSGKYNDEGKFLPWVQRIAHNLVVDYFRKSQRMRMVRDKEDYSVIGSLRLTDENMQDKMMREQTYTILHKLIDELPYEQREVIILRHFGDMSFKEVADATGVCLNTSLGRMRYALISLRKLMEKRKLVMRT